MVENKSLLNDAGFERSVLSGILNHGSNLFLDIEDIIEAKDFHYSINQKIFSIIKHLVHDKNIQKFDIPTIIAGATFINYDKFKDGEKENNYLEALFDTSPSQDNTKSIALCVYKLSLARQANKCLQSVTEEINKINGSEKIDDIIKSIEEPVLEFTGKLTKSNNEMTQICEGIDETLKAVSETPKDIVGLPTGFTNWDYCVGGGLRRGTIHVIGARPKGAKSFICLNIGKNVADNGIPVLYLDTELSRAIQMNRLTGLVSGVETDRVETGKFSTMPEEAKAIENSKPKLKNMLMTHCNIAGQSMESILSYARRWIIKHVGINDNGQANPCLLIYDYIKLMDDDGLKRNVAETQLLGFMMTSIHNFALKWDIPVLVTAQLNRDGVEKEGGEVAAGSDRILWLCSSFTILKNKLQEELADDPPSNGAKKLVVTDTRFGPGMEKGDYINIHSDLSRAKLKEGKLYSTIVSGSFKNEKKNA